MLANTVTEKGEQLQIIDFKLIESITSLITIVSNGWLTKNRQPFTGIGIQYIDNTTGTWTLKSLLLSFESSKKRHTGKEIGRELVRVVKEYDFTDKVGWTVGDNLQANDVGIHYLCKKLNQERKATPLKAREVCGRHAFHLGPSHFVKALNVVGIVASKKRLHHQSTPNEESDDEDVAPEDEYDEDLDPDTSMDLEADESDPLAVQEAQITDFEPGDVMGKLLAFLNQLRSSSEPTRIHFETVCKNVGIQPRKLKQWVRTRWGSLADCLESAVNLQKAIDWLCRSADEEDAVAPLRNG
ncbi:hypothetical protein MD484_g7495, partial [Candolleomyces efflorescens]